MTALDLFLVLVFFGVCVWSLVQRVIRQLMTLAVLFVATAIAGFAYPYGALALAVIQEQAPTLADGIAFLVLFLFFATVLEVLLRRAFPDTHLPRLRAVDNILGLLPGVLSALVIVSLLLSIVGHSVQRSWGDIAPRVRRTLFAAVRDTALRPYLARFMGYYLDTHALWFPRTPPLLGYLLR